MYIWVASRIERFYPCLINVRGCPVNAKIPAPKIEALPMETEKTELHFSQKLLQQF
jgi:hypothetical protein